MKNLLKYGFIMLALVLAFASCSKTDELLFDQANLVYVEYQDSSDYTFATSPSTVLIDSIIVNYRIIGTVSPKDRVINLVPTAATTAKAGYHYKVGPAVVKANTFVAKVPIYVYRRAGLKDSTLVVALQIKDNEDFKAGFPTRLRYKFTLTDILNKPSNWETTWVSYFGSYSVVKFKFLIAVTGKTNWNGSPLPQDSRYLSQKARNALLEYNQANGALIDEFGQQVFFP
jgi:hypothetical protein